EQSFAFRRSGGQRVNWKIIHWRRHVFAVESLQSASAAARVQKLHTDHLSVIGDSNVIRSMSRGRNVVSVHVEGELMRRLFLATAVTAALVVCSGELIPAQSGGDKTITLGPRPFFLVDGMDDGPLKDSLLKCGKGPFQRTDFSIG